MRTTRLPLVLLGLSCLAFLACVLLTANALPERVATHFNLDGRANGWMSRSAHLQFMAGFGLALPLFIAGVCFALRFAPDSSINIPHRDFWLAPERRAATCQYLFGQSLWLACLNVAFITGVHLLVVRANQLVPPHLPLTPVLVWAGCLIVGLVFWALTLIRHFKHRDA